MYAIMLLGKRCGSLEYKCSNKTSIREENIESFLLNNIKKIAKGYIVKNTIVNHKPHKDNSAKIKELESKIFKLKDLYLEDLIDKDTYKRDYLKLTSELQKVKTENEKAPQRDFTHLQNFINQDITTIYSSLNVEEKRRFWLSIIDKIQVNDGKIEDVTFL